MFSLSYLTRLKEVNKFACRRFISVLYVTGDKAKENYAPLTPYMDFDKRLGDLSKLNENIHRRRLIVDLKGLKEKYENFTQLHKIKAELEHSREEITKRIKGLSPTTYQSEIENLKKEGVAVRNKLKDIKEQLYPVEDSFIHQFLSLPNELHYKCPPGVDEALIYSFGPHSGNLPSPKSHLDRTDIIHFIDNGCYYLLDEAAEFELYCSRLCRDIFTSKNFVSTVNPDFTRKILIEANLTSIDQYHGVKEADPKHEFNSAFLTGGGSFESFLGHLTKLTVFPSVLPLRLVSTGRQYMKKREESLNIGLYGATQTNTVQTLVATRTAKEADEQMDDILNLAVDFYKHFNIHFRIVYAKVSDMTNAEALRASIQVYSPVYSKYIEVGHVSHYLDFVSERILFNVKENKESKFLHLVGGPVVSSTALIAALIENDLPLKMNVDDTSKPSQVEIFKSLFK